mmetsp:Transcript_39016/g.74810  ORF Transcript_39016/g.74810 Transcript_39016/m.74810 type:complete len:232 (-) Transcript_39016:214-909(-)
MDQTFFGQAMLVRGGMKRGTPSSPSRSTLAGSPPTFALSSSANAFAETISSSQGMPLEPFSDSPDIFFATCSVNAASLSCLTTTHKRCLRTGCSQRQCRERLHWPVSRKSQQAWLMSPRSTRLVVNPCDFAPKGFVRKANKQASPDCSVVCRIVSCAHDKTLSERAMSSARTRMMIDQPRGSGSTWTLIGTSVIRASTALAAAVVTLPANSVRGSSMGKAMSKEDSANACT